MQLSLSFPLASSRSWRAVGLLFCTGGALWIVYYSLQLAYGFSTGQPPSHNLFEGFCFAAAIVSLCVALLGIALRLRGALAMIGGVFAAIAATSAVMGFIVGAISTGVPGIWGGVGVIGSCLSATFVALATKRCAELPLHWSRALLLVGLLTFPIIVAFSPLEQWVPAFLSDELPFALSGAAYFALGRALLARQR